MVYSGNFFLNESQMQANAEYVHGWLSARGWSKNAIAGLLGNFQVESTINPGIWQNLDKGNTGLGYGLVQWTPATKYLDWCEGRGLEASAMDSALLRIEYELANGLQYYPTDSYPETFAEFKVSTKSAYYLGMAFVTNYERPAEITTARGTNAAAWYEYIKNLEGGTSEPSEPEGAGEWKPREHRPLPIWMMTLRKR